MTLKNKWKFTANEDALRHTHDSTTSFDTQAARMNVNQDKC